LFAKAYSHNISPFLFVSSFKVCLPVISVHPTPFPNFAFRPPSIITASHLEIHPLQTENKKRSLLSSTILSFVGAHTLISVILLYLSSILNLHILHYVSNPKIYFNAFFITMKLVPAWPVVLDPPQ